MSRAKPWRRAQVEERRRRVEGAQELFRALEREFGRVPPRAVVARLRRMSVWQLGWLNRFGRPRSLGGILARSAAESVVYARVTTRDGRTFDPCTLVCAPRASAAVSPHFSVVSPWHVAAERYDPERTVVGGEIARVEATAYLLPPAIRAAAARTPNADRDSLEPLVISIRGSLSYLVEANAVYFAAGDLRGRDADPFRHARPQPGAGYVCSEPVPVTTAYVAFR